MAVCWISTDLNCMHCRQSELLSCRLGQYWSDTPTSVETLFRRRHFQVPKFFCKTAATNSWQCFTPVHSLKLRRGRSYPCEPQRVKKHELSVRSDAPTSIVQLPSLEATSNKLAQGVLQRDILRPLPLCSMPHPLISHHNPPSHCHTIESLYPTNSY